MVYFKLKKCLNFFYSINTLRRVGNDLRKGGAIVGAGLIGLVLAKDNISISESIIFCLIGLYCWCLGVVFETVADHKEELGNYNNTLEKGEENE